MRPIPTWMLFMPAVGQMLDVITTMTGLRIGLDEANPIVQPLLATPPLFIGIKLAVGLLGGWLSAWIESKGQLLGAWITLLINIMGPLGPATWNIYLLWKHL